MLFFLCLAYLYTSRPVSTATESNSESSIHCFNPCLFDPAQSNLLLSDESMGTSGNMSRYLRVNVMRTVVETDRRTRKVCVYACV